MPIVNFRARTDYVNCFSEDLIECQEQGALMVTEACLCCDEQSVSDTLFGLSLLVTVSETRYCVAY